jgi:hypothetical protein
MVGGDIGDEVGRLVRAYEVGTNFHFHVSSPLGV